ncbi:hypothetical protein IF2G_10826 [Cordyceps javanica]|nr:hypothetical protein IF2G_10826 [Cordyceps javanica]
MPYMPRLSQWSPSTAAESPRHYNYLWQCMKEDPLARAKHPGTRQAFVYSPQKDNYVYLVCPSGRGSDWPMKEMRRLPFKEYTRTGKYEIKIGGVTINVQNFVTGCESISVPSLACFFDAGGKTTKVWVSRPGEEVVEMPVLQDVAAFQSPFKSRRHEKPTVSIHWAGNLPVTRFHAEAPATDKPYLNGPYKEVWNAIDRDWIQNQIWDDAPPALICSKTQPKYVYLVFANTDEREKRDVLKKDQIPFRKDLKRQGDYHVIVGKVTVNVAFLMISPSVSILYENPDWFLDENGEDGVCVCQYGKLAEAIEPRRVVGQLGPFAPPSKVTIHVERTNMLIPWAKFEQMYPVQI